MKNYRWGILGCGKIAQKMATALLRTERAELYAVASSSFDRAEEFKSRFGAQKAYASYEELANDPGVDIIYIATPHSHHYIHTRLCLEAGKAVLCEKPFTLDAPELLELITLARSKKLFLMEALWTRFLPHINKSLQLVEEGAIGQAVLANADFGFRADFLPEGRLFNRELGGGALLDIGIYPVFFAYLFLGTPLQISAQATFGQTGVDEQVTISMEHPNSAISGLNCSLLTKTRMEATLFGTAGSIRMYERWYAPTRIELLRENKLVESFDFSQSDNGFEYEVEEVMNCLDRGLTESPAWSLDNSLELIGILDGIRNKCGISYPNRIRK